MQKANGRMQNCGFKKVGVILSLRRISNVSRITAKIINSEKSFEILHFVQNDIGFRFYIG
jgi:hypothetical protein